MEKELEKIDGNTREKVIVKTSIIGIIANIFLAGFKAFVGLAANSIAVILDAVNNLSDALSSIITIVGTKLAGKHPNKKHPFGYGRVEYMSAGIVAGIVLYAGITSLVESVKKIIHPEKADYSTLALVIIAVAVVVKLLLGLYVKKQGKKVNSGALVASGSDALFDAILSVSVLASAILFITTGVSLEAYVGALISIIIIKAGIEMLGEVVSEMLGKREDAKLINQIKALLREEPEIRGAYDVILYNYGPDKNLGSVHLELPDTMTVKEVDELTRRVQVKIYKETGILLSGVGVYSYNTQNDEAAALECKVREKVLAHDYVVQMHGFYVNPSEKSVRFDAVLTFDIDFGEGVKSLKEELEKDFQGYTFSISPDVDFSVTE